MIIIGIAGGTGSGKTTVVNEIVNRIPENGIARIPQDCYYKDNKDLTDMERKKYNFDHPDAIEFDLLCQHIKSLKENSIVQMPTYDYITSSRLDNTIQVLPKKVIIVEGILVLTHKPLRELMDIKVFIDVPADDRLIRVIERDINERGRNTHEVINRYKHTVKPMHKEFIEPSKYFADIIIPHGGQNKAAINFLVSAILNKLKLSE